MALIHGKYIKIVNIPRGALTKVAPKAMPKPIVEEVDEDIPCRFCSKVFANEVAIKNHVRMHHFGEEVDINVWVNEAKMKRNIKPEPVEIEISIETDSGSADEPASQVSTDHTPGQSPAKLVKAQTPVKRSPQATKIISSVKPINILSLASQDVSYMIIKAEDGIPMAARKRTKQAEDKKAAEEAKKAKKVKDTTPITGPFECLESSNSLQDGLCHQIFFSCCDYSIHHRDEHTKRRKGVKCQVCEKILANAIGEEPPSSPYPCQVCGAGFDTSEALAAHTASDHIKIRPYECSVCHKRFTQPGGVTQHMRLHTDDRPYSCTFCTKAFRQKSGLDQHIRIHTNEKPYKCVICKRAFCQSVQLKQHMRTHTNLTPYECTICDRKFKQPTYLKYHLKHHFESHLDEEQKQKYYDMISMLKRKNIEQGDYEEHEQDEQVMMNEVEYDCSEKMELVYDDDQIVTEVDGDEIVLEADQNGGELVLDKDQEYILSENGQEVIVRIVEDVGEEVGEEVDEE